MAEPFVGEIRLFAFGLIPRGWLPCNGQIIAVSGNQALFSVIGNRYGGNGNTNFALPDLRGRTPLDTSNEYPIATSGGEATHVLTVNEIPPHTHSAQGSSTAATDATPQNRVWGTAVVGRELYSPQLANTTMNAEAIEFAGSNQGHNNMQPYAAVSYCIALSGFYPTRN